MGIKMWWEFAFESPRFHAVIIVPDGQDRWVITASRTRLRNTASIWPICRHGIRRQVHPASASTRPRPTRNVPPRIEGPDFDLKFMGTREEGLTELILSANRLNILKEHACRPPFAYDSEFLLYDWAYALTGDKGDFPSS